jgi:hypothetical protein
MLTTPLNPIPLFILPLLEKSLFAQRRIGLMMFCMMLQIALISVVAGKATHYPPESFEFA